MAPTEDQVWIQGKTHTVNKHFTLLFNSSFEEHQKWKVYLYFYSQFNYKIMWNIIFPKQMYTELQLPHTPAHKLEQ